MTFESSEVLAERSMRTERLQQEENEAVGGLQSNRFKAFKINL